MAAWGPTLLARLAARREVVVFDGVAQGLTREVEPHAGSITPGVLAEARLAWRVGCRAAQHGKAALN